MVEHKAELVPAAKQNVVTIRKLLDGYKNELARILPKNLTPELLARQVMTAISKNPRIADCTAISVIGSVVECAQLGLSFDPTLGHAALVPFKAACQFMPMYRGYVELALRSATIGSIRATVVRKDDMFQLFEGTHYGIEHKAVRPLSMNEKDWTGAYTVIRYLNGFVDCEYMEREEILLCKERSPSVRSARENGKKTPWDTDPEPMWKKTVIRRHMRRISLSASDRRLEKMAAADEYREAGAIKTGLGIDDYEFVPNGGATEPAAPPSEPQSTDDDKPKGKRAAKSEKKAEAPKPKDEPVAKAEKISEKARQALFTAAVNALSSVDKGRMRVAEVVVKYGFKNSSEVTIDKYDQVMKEVSAK